ncbi:hypothetical protein [Methanosphaerula subterraneus]|uniref:hypothetical protein n=1 Tax=Methanosphaerula subterraneus TaxID=3350244 RepID=UPI003F8588CC
MKKPTPAIIGFDEEQFSKVIHQSLFDQITTQNCYTRLLIEGAPGADLRSRYQERIRSISNELKDLINYIMENHCNHQQSNK